MGRRTMALGLATVVLVGCSAAPGSQPATAGEAELAAAEATRQPASADDARSAATGINDFGFGLLRQLASEGENTVISPTSIALALGMARLGARGVTAEEMDTVLHEVGAPENAAWLNALDQALASRTGTYEDQRGVPRPLALHLANASFAQRGMAIEDGYLNALAESYGAGLRLVDFAGDPHAAIQQVNDWVDEATEHRIPDLLSGDQANPRTRLVLANAIYLKAPWNAPFPEGSTHARAFTRADGSNVQVPMMETAELMGYAEGEGWQAVDLPYVGETISMTLILADDHPAFLTALDASRFEEIVDSFSEQKTGLILPKFGIETRMDLREVLSAGGMPTAFTGAADFSGISVSEDLHIGYVIHQANIDVDEAGTEAAAATAVGVYLSGPQAYLELDRPFIFALRDRETSAVLFLGHVGDPSAGQADE